MLSLDDLLQFAEKDAMPTSKRRGIVREYLQTLILLALQHHPMGRKLIFIGGTALRFFYGFQRFSEDLDFNSRGVLTRSRLEVLMRHVQQFLQKENIIMTFSIRKSQEAYVHWKAYLSFPEILHQYGCAGRFKGALHVEEKLSLQLDFHQLGRHSYPIEKKVIARFGQRFLFTTTTLNMFLAEKSNAMLFRKDPRGRDFFDFMSLVLEGAQFDRAAMKKREVIVKDKKEYAQLLLKRIKYLDFSRLTAQMAPFLFRPEDIEIMKNFPKQVTTFLRKIE